MTLEQEVAIAATRSAADELVRALRTVPALSRSWRPGGTANDAIGIVSHCVIGARFLASIFAGTPIPYRTQADRDAAIDGIETVEQAEAALNGAVADVCDSIASLSPARLSELMIMPWGERMPYARGILAPALHLQYHAGQINYIQCLMGDDEHH